MARSKFINTFNTTADYENYIESALPEFPNVGYDKEAGEVKIMRTSPNDHVIYGELIDNYDGNPPKFNINFGNYVEAHVDTLTNTFYIDETDLPSSIDSLRRMFYNDDSFNHKKNIKSIKKFGINTSQITRFDNLFFQVANISSINLNGVTIQNDSTVNTTSAFEIYNNVLKDVYINIESTLMKLTNNLSSQGNSYIPSSATIHYNDVDYVWQNNAWTPQS